MNIIKHIESKYRKSPDFGVRFSIDPEAYICDISDERLALGEPNIFMNCGVSCNNQPILIDGVEVGFVHERTGYGLSPMITSFMVGLDDEVSEETRQDPHFLEDEWNYMCFATLQQMIDYLRKIKTIC